MNHPPILPFFWFEQSQDAPRELESLFPESLQEFRASGVITAIALAASYFFESVLFQACLIASTTHLATRYIKKTFAGSPFICGLEEMSLTLNRQIPYFYILTALIGLLFAWYLFPITALAAASMGILSGLTIDVTSTALLAHVTRGDR